MALRNVEEELNDFSGDINNYDDFRDAIDIFKSLEEIDLSHLSELQHLIINMLMEMSGAHEFDIPMGVNLLKFGSDCEDMMNEFLECVNKEEEEESPLIGTFNKLSSN